MQKFKIVSSILVASLFISSVAIAATSYERVYPNVTRAYCASLGGYFSVMLFTKTDMTPSTSDRGNCHVVARY